MIEHVEQGEELQQELRHLLDLAVLGDHLRWVLVGDTAGDLADWLSDAVPQWRALAEQVSQHLVSLGVAPDGRVRSLAEDISLHWVPEGWLRPDEARRLIAYRLRAAGGWACYRRSQATDPDTVGLLDAVCSGLEAHARSVELMLVDNERTVALERANRWRPPFGPRAAAGSRASSSSPPSAVRPLARRRRPDLPMGLTADVRVDAEPGALEADLENGAIK